MKKNIHFLFYVFLCIFFYNTYLFAEVKQHTLFQIKAGDSKDQVYYRILEDRQLSPRGLCTNGNDFYIGDIHKNRILIVDKKGDFLNEIKNKAFSDLSDIYCYTDSVWVTILDHYYETASLLKYTSEGKFVFKVNPEIINNKNKIIVDYHIEKSGIYAITQDDTVIKINTNTGKPDKTVPSFWFDKDGYYTLTREKENWALSIYNRSQGKLQKNIKLVSKNNKPILLRKVNDRVYLEKYDEKQKAYVLYHYDQEGNIDEQINKDITLEKYFDLEYAINLSHPKADHIKIIQYEMVSDGLK